MIIIIILFWQDINFISVMVLAIIGNNAHKSAGALRLALA